MDPEHRVEDFLEKAVGWNVGGAEVWEETSMRRAVDAAAPTPPAFREISRAYVRVSGVCGASFQQLSCRKKEQKI